MSFIIGLVIGLIAALVLYLKMNSTINTLRFEVDTMDKKIDERVVKITNELDDDQQVRIANIVKDYETKEKALESFFQSQLEQQVEDARDEIETSIHEDIADGAWQQFAERQEQKRIRDRAQAQGKGRLYKSILDNDELTHAELEVLQQEAEDGPGIYIIHNKTRDKYLVGKGDNVVAASLQSYEPSESDLYSDSRDGNIFLTRIIYLQRSHFKTLDRLERDAVELFESDTKGYN